MCDITKGKKCEVCARGALFVAAVERFDNLSFGQLNIDDWDKQHGQGFAPYIWKNYEFRFFTRKQIVMIETAFEQSLIDEIVVLSDNLLDKCRNFAPKVKSAKGRMTAIMKNIVRNQGTFVP